MDLKIDSIIQIDKTGIGVDIDETLSWTVGYWIEEMQKLFGNPENLSVKEMVDKYSYAQNIPYWQSEDALKWMEEKRNSNELQKKLPLIENSNHFLNKISKIITIAAYITIRPESVSSGTKHWLLKHNFPKAPIIFRPDKIPAKEGNKWKAKIIEKLYPKIAGFIDDSLGVIESLSEDYKGTIFHYNTDPVMCRSFVSYPNRELNTKCPTINSVLYNTKLKVINCKDWQTIYEQIKINKNNLIF